MGYESKPHQWLSNVSLEHLAAEDPTCDFSVQQRFKKVEKWNGC